MYLPKRKPKPQANPFRVEASVRFIYASGLVALMAAGMSLIYASQKVQQRDRRTQRELRVQRPGRRVVIVGAGAGGAALAASLCSSSPDVHVTVIEQDKKQTFMAAYPLAHVGHRSYDLNTSGGIDLLRSPASWNVTRDANLVMGEVVDVLTGSREVVVSPMGGAVATFSAKKGGKAAAAEKPPPPPPPATSAAGFLDTLYSTVTGGSGPEADAEVTKVGESAFRAMPDGLQAYPYDVLVVAAGAKRNLGPLEGILPGGLGDLDCYGIAVNPGVTRDTLAHLYQGNVLHVKVPPRSFCVLMEAERKAKGLREPAVLVYDGAALAVGGTTEDRRFFSVMAKLSGLAKAADSTTTSISSSSNDLLPRMLHPYMFATARQHDSTFASATNIIWKYLDYFSKLSCCQLIAVTADADPLGPAPAEVDAVLRGFWRLLQDHTRFAATTDGADEAAAASAAAASGSAAAAAAGGGRTGGFVVQTPGSSEKTIVVRLPESVVEAAAPSLVADAKGLVSDKKDPLDAIPRVDGDARPPHFHFINNSYLTAVDPAKQMVTLYNHAHNVLVSLPYRLLLLDLPLRAPSFIAESGLARENFASTNAPATLQSTMAGAAGAGGKQAPFARPGSRPSNAVAAAFEDDGSFMDVDPGTLQHRRHPNVFALGDVAGLPTVKGYGSTLAQVPVVAHNVQQVLYNVKANERIEADRARYRAALADHTAAVKQQEQQSLSAFSFLRRSSHKETEEVEGEGDAARDAAATEAALAPPREPSADWYRPRRPNAVYDGYSSYSVAMTTWRAMWPEMALDQPELRALRGVTDGKDDGTLPLPVPVPGADLSRRLHQRDNHMWNSLAWRDLRGLGNGAFCQTSAYEFMHFFLFNRGAWYPPGWFSIPTYSAADGTPDRVSWGLTSIL